MEKKNFYRTMHRAGHARQIVLSICLHRVFKTQFSIRLSIFRQHLLAFISPLPRSKHPASEYETLYSSASMMKLWMPRRCRSCARTHVIARTHRRNAADRASSSLERSASFIYARLHRTGGRLLGFIERIISRLASVFYRLNQLQRPDDANAGRVLRNRFALFARSTIIYFTILRDFAAQIARCKSNIVETRKSVAGERDRPERRIFQRCERGHKGIAEIPMAALRSYAERREKKGGSQPRYYIKKL